MLAWRKVVAAYYSSLVDEVVIPTGICRKPSLACVDPIFIFDVIVSTLDAPISVMGSSGDDFGVEPSAVVGGEGVVAL
jgi:hypothetical protein